MATIAQVAAQRRRQVAAVKSVYRIADTAGESLQRKLTVYASKKKLIEAKDMAALTALYDAYTKAVEAIEKPLRDLLTLTGA